MRLPYRANVYKVRYDLVNDNGYQIGDNTDEATIVAEDFDSAVELAKKAAPEVRSQSAVHRTLRVRDIQLLQEDAFVGAVR